MRSDGFKWCTVMRATDGHPIICGPFLSYDEAWFVGTAEENEFRVWNRLGWANFDRVAEMREFASDDA